MNKSPQGIKTSVSGKHFKPSLKLVRMRPRTASNHCKHRQPQTSENHGTKPQTPQSASKSSAATPKHAANIRLAAKHLPEPQPAGHHARPITVNQPRNHAKQPVDRPTDGPAQPANQQPTNQPTSQPVRPTCGVRALKPTPREQATCRLPKLEPLSAPQNEVHNL